MGLQTTSCFKISLLLFLVTLFEFSSSKVQHKVRCSEEEMIAELVKNEDYDEIYLDQLRHYPDQQCRPVIEGNKITFKLSLIDIHRCGVTRITNEITGKKFFYHRIVMEPKSKDVNKQFVVIKCVLAPKNVNHTVWKRNVLPAGFQEPEDLEITTSLTETAPKPTLNVGVRQGKEMISGELNVNPGTPLTMEIYLDKSSAPVYGVLVSYMQVTDTKHQEETIIFNGCSVDPYLFENFNTVDGDFLSAKFRAFKFPDSTYVQFKGTVNVCLDKCQGVQCSTGQIGYGRRKRAVASMPADPNKVFEVSLTTFLKVNFNNKTLEQLQTEEYITKTKNSTKNLFLMKDGLNQDEEDDMDGMFNNGVDKNQKLNDRKLKLASETFKEEFKYSVIEEKTNNSPATNIISYSSTILLVLSARFFY